MSACVKFVISWRCGLENRGKAWYNILKKNKRNGYICPRKAKGQDGENRAANADLPHAKGGKKP